MLLLTTNLLVVLCRLVLPGVLPNRHFPEQQENNNEHFRGGIFLICAIMNWGTHERAPHRCAQRETSVSI